MRKLILLALLVGCSKPNYKIKDCAKDSIFGMIRQVKQVTTYTYKYKLYDPEIKKWMKQDYIMRIKDFERIMKRCQCPKQ